MSLGDWCVNMESFQTFSGYVYSLFHCVANLCFNQYSNGIITEFFVKILYTVKYKLRIVANVDNERNIERI